MEAFLKCKKTKNSNGVTLEILRRMRIEDPGDFLENLFKRYNSRCFRCRVCNGVFEGTHAHSDLHGSQVIHTLWPSDYKAPPSWAFTDTPTLEAIQTLDAELSKKVEPLSGFDVETALRKR